MTKCVVHRWLYGVEVKGEIQWQRNENVDSNVRVCSECDMLHVAQKTWVRFVKATEKAKG